jgi:hypothetical protein
MKALCQSADGVCSQCGECLSNGLRRTCPAWIKASPNRHQRGLGTRLRDALSRIGYTRERHLAIKQRLGLSQECGCAKREAWLNQFGRRVMEWWRPS